MARLATVNAAGDADLVPVTFAIVTGETLVTAVDHKPKSTTALARLDNVRRHPVVTVLVDHYSNDWSSLWWVRLRGPASVVDPGGAGHAEAVDALAARYAQYRERPPAGAAIVVDVREVRGWAAVGSGPDE